MASDFAVVFTSFNAHLESEASKKDNIAARVKDVAATSRALTANLQRLQMCNSHAGSLSFIMRVKFREISFRRSVVYAEIEQVLQAASPLFTHLPPQVLSCHVCVACNVFGLLPVFNFSVCFISGHQWASVRAAIGDEHPEKFRYMWRFSVVDLVAAASLVHFCRTRSLLPLTEASAAIGCTRVLVLMV